MIKERTKLGIARARAEGRWGNAKFALTPIQQKEALRMLPVVPKIYRIGSEALRRVRDQACIQVKGRNESRLPFLVEVTINGALPEHPPIQELPSE